MSVAANKVLIELWFEEVWNQGRADLIDHFRAPEAVATGLAAGTEASQGAEPFKVFHANLRQAFPDLHIAVEDILGEEDRVTARITMEGTHLGDALGVAPTGKKVRFSGITLARIKNGKISEAWNSLDLLGLLTQIGAVHDPAGSKRFLLRRTP